LSRRPFSAKLPVTKAEQRVAQANAAVGASAPASEQLVRRSVAMILAQSRAGAVTAIAMGGLFGFIYVPAVGWLAYLAWYLVFAAAMAGRQLYFQRLVARAGVTPATLRRIAIVAAFTGWIASLSVPLFARYLTISDVGVITIIIVGWISVAVAVLAVQPRVYAIYLTASLATVYLGWIRHAQPSDLLLIGISMVLGGRMLVKLGQQVYAHLRDTVAAAEQNASLVDQLREALARQQEAQQARSRFLGAASHDLRQPVQALLFLSDIFRKSTDAARRDAMALQITRTGESIDSMFRHLVDFAQIDAGTMKAVLQPVQLDRLVASAITGYAEKCAAKGLRFRLEQEAPLTVSADPVLLERLLRNFLDNACKYSLQGEIVLRLEACAGEALVSVVDQGIGMHEHELAQACNAFYRGPSGSVAEAEGIGLGLDISRHMADLMRADLQLQSRFQQGTTVRLRLPLGESRQPAAAPVAARPGAAPLEGLLVAVLENDRLAREALCAWLGEAGAAVAQGASLAQLREALRQAGRKPDFLVADFRLAEGEGDGVGAIAALRAEYGSLPALVVSGEPDLAERDLGVPVLQKPVTPERLLECLRQALPAAAGAAARPIALNEAA
jgi:signal transduction histidine kinase/CheY-like chemotaxis protein